MATAVTNNVTSIAREASSSGDSSHANPYYILAKHLAQVLADAAYVRALSRIPEEEVHLALTTEAVRVCQALNVDLRRIDMGKLKSAIREAYQSARTRAAAA